MAPAQKNVEACDRDMQSQLKMRLLLVNDRKEGEHCDNNNSVDSISEKVNVDTEFDLEKFEAMEFKARYRWPDLTVQVLLHLVSIYGLYLMLTFKVKFLTTLFAFLTIYTSGFGITAGVHRLWSHRAYQARTSLRVLLALLFTVTGQLASASIFYHLMRQIKLLNERKLYCWCVDEYRFYFVLDDTGALEIYRTYYPPIVFKHVLAPILMFGQRDIYTWALDHRVHHKYTETAADPHDIRRGFWFAHVGWLVLTPHPAVEDRRAALRKTSLDLETDPVVRWQKKYFIPLFGLLNVVLPVWVPWYCWGETLEYSFVVSFVTRFTITLNIAFCVNSFAHLWGNKPYDRFIKSTENTFVSLAALGEGWHNYHHVFPWDYRTSELGRVNISTSFIDAFAKIGWAYNLKTATQAMILGRAKRNGDGTLGETEEPDPTLNNEGIE